MRLASLGAAFDQHPEAGSHIGQLVGAEAEVRPLQLDSGERQAKGEYTTNVIPHLMNIKITKFILFIAVEAARRDLGHPV